MEKSGKLGKECNKKLFKFWFEEIVHVWTNNIRCHGSDCGFCPDARHGRQWQVGRVRACQVPDPLARWEKRIEPVCFVLIFASLWDVHSPASSSLWMSSVTLLRALPSNHPSPDILVAWSQLWDFLILFLFKGHVFCQMALLFQFWSYIYIYTHL